MANDKHIRNFSEGKGLNSIKKCRLCKEPIPKIALAFSNSVAIEEGYCCWMCMISHLGDEKAYARLGDKSKQNRAERPQERRSG